MLCIRCGLKIPFRTKNPSVYQYFFVIVIVCGLCRWRNSLLCGLLFGGPTMAVMAYYMWAMWGTKACHQQPVNDTPSSSLTSPAADADCYEMLMIVSGLSLRNLLLFIFCTPCQVSLHMVISVVLRIKFNMTVCWHT